MSSDTLSATKRIALAMVDKVRDMIINDCDDETIIKTIPKVEISPNKGFIESDYLSYDDAIKELGMGYNRNKLSELAKKYNIQNHKFRHMPIGFHKDDIARLKEILNNDK